MNEMCNDNRFKLIEKYKERLKEATNIEHSTEEMKVLDDILFRFWQMGWLDRLDKYEKIRNVYEEWEEKIKGVFGADDETMSFVLNLRKIFNEVEE